MNRFNDIRGWAMDRNLISGSTTDKQFIKLVEECGELAHSLARGNREGQIDAIGDMVVVLTILAAQNGWNIEDCIESAYNEIKDRKGRMINNVFVKARNMLSDYSEALIEMKRLIREAEDLCNKKEFESARQVVYQMRNECDALSNWLWKHE